MALTEAEEAKFRLIASAYDNGITINQLPKADSNSPSKYVLEGQAKDTGESVQIPLAEVVSVVNSKMAVRRWNETLSTPKGEAYGNIDFLRELPNVLGLGCYLVTDDRRRRKLDPTNHYRFDDGSPAALDGTQGQYMWCWNEHYYAMWVEGNYTYEAVSLEPMKGKECYHIPAGGISALGGGVMDRTNSILCSVVNDTPQFRGCNNDASRDGTYRSQLGRVATNIQYRSFSTYARKRGEGWEACWYVARAVPEYLFRIIFGTRDSQDAVNANKDANGLYQGGLGAGITNMPDWSGYNGYYPFIPTSAGLELGDGCGEVNFDVLKEDGTVHYAAKIPVFFGLKHLFGHTWDIVRGVQINAGAEKTEAFVAPSMYAGFDDTKTDGLIKAAELPRNEAYVKKVSMNKLCCLPTVVGGSASTYYCDYFYTNAQSSQGLRCRLVGGSANDGTSAGAFCSYVSNAWSNTNTTVSAPLCYFEEDPIVG